MAKVFGDHGEEFVQDLVINSGKTFDIALYADADGPNGGNIADAVSVSESDDVSVIESGSEPSGSAYNRQQDAASNFSASLDSNNDVKITGTTQTYDVSDSSQSVNAYMIIVPFASDLVSSDGGAATDHLMYTAFLDQEYDLSQFDNTVDFDPAELTLD